MSMNEFLAAYYGTGTPQQEDVNQNAQMEFFAKTAAANGIDLSQLSDEQINYLWNQTFIKSAEEEGSKKDEEEDKKEEKAKEEFEAKKESMAKVAEADFMGRVMAHAYVDEMDKIAKSRSGGVTLGSGVSGEGHEAKQLAKIRAENAARESAAQSAKWEGRAAAAGGGHSGGKSALTAGDRLQNLKVKGRQAASEAGAAARKGGKAALEFAGKHKGKAALVGAGLAAGAGIGAAAHHYGQKKAASALDEKAAEVAIMKVAAAGWDTDEAADLLDAALTLGVTESEKIASAYSYEHGLDIRALELLEAVGYPIEWAE